MKHFSLFVLASGTLLIAATADYFPVETGNAWTFSYISTSSSVMPNPPITKDSGTVKWEIVLNGELRLATEAILLVGVKQTRSLMRRTLTQPGVSGYDSVFIPPRTTIDTIKFWQPSLAPKAIPISFENGTCPFAVHNPTVLMPALLSAIDTTVLFQGSSIAAKRMVVSECSCLPEAMRLYSFTLGPVVGPVEAYITACGEGVAFNETWKLIGRDYPVSAFPGNTQRTARKTAAANPAPGRITCSFDMDRASLVRIELTDLQGRLLRTLLRGNLSAGAHRFSWDIPEKARGLALLRVRTGSEERCVKIMTGIK